MKNSTQMSDKNKSGMNMNWLQVIAFGSDIDNVNQQAQSLKPISIFEVMP